MKWILLPVVILLSSCALLKPDRQNVLAGYTPEGIAEPSRQTQWWMAFESEQLNGLMGEAFAGNLTLEQAAARLEQAEASARKSGAAGKISLSGTASASSRYQSNFNDTGNSRTDPDFSLGLQASYELDLWGRLKSTEKAAIANWEASRFDLQTAAMTLSANLAQIYFKWLAQNEVLDIYESQLNSNSNKLEAIELRYRTGQATSLAVLQQRQQTAAAKSRIPTARGLLESYENSLSVLTGKVPGTDLGLVTEPLPALPSQPVSGLPANLLENRPDIQAARLRLESGDWNVAAARAARLPSISLTGNISTSSEDIENLFDDWVSNLAANLFAPLLDGGSRRAEVDRTLAVSHERIAAYRQTVLEAVEETVNALSGEKHQTEYVEAVTRQYTAAQNSETESLRRYRRGALPYIDVLSAVVSRESLEITLAQAKANLLSDRIQLYRALGGDWTFILEEDQ
jgi:NodT family efflux transporter outer membrane factor (OMF) lipoprotein